MKSNPGYQRIIKDDQLTLGLMYPIESFKGDQPKMENPFEIAKSAEELGYAALWVRDVPLRDPNFGDVGQVYDTWTFLGALTAVTSKVALGTASIILPFSHPVLLAKQIASIDQLSAGRLILGVASGDRPSEYPAFNANFENRAETFRNKLHTIRELLFNSFPHIESEYGNIHNNLDLIPKLFANDIPTFVTGHSGQSLEWICQHSHGWLMYPNKVEIQKQRIDNWHHTCEQYGVEQKPFMQSLYIDLVDDPNEQPTPIHLGFKLGINYFKELIEQLQAIKVKHVILNLKYGSRPAAEVVQQIGEEVIR